MVTETRYAELLKEQNGNRYMADTAARLEDEAAHRHSERATALQKEFDELGSRANAHDIDTAESLAVHDKRIAEIDAELNRSRERREHARIAREQDSAKLFGRRRAEITELLRAPLLYPVFPFGPAAKPKPADSTDVQTYPGAPGTC